MRTLYYSETDEFVAKELSIINQLISFSSKELEEYQKTDTESYGIQATEKLWGALAHMVRLSQYLQGAKFPQSHEDNRLYMKELVSAKEEQELVKRADKMHRRFYTGEFDYIGIKKDLDYVRQKKNEFMKRMQVK